MRTDEVNGLFDWAASTRVPGVAGAVGARGEATPAVAGKADLESGLEVTTRTRFRGYSIAKPFTALAVMRLSLAGTISLDAPANSYLSDLRIELPDGSAAPVTIRNLLTHTATLEPILQRVGSVRHGLRFREIADGHIRCVGRPGSAWAYSNEGFGVLQEVIGDVAGRDFVSFMNELLADIGITDGRFSSDLLSGSTVAKGYDQADKEGWSLAPKFVVPIPAAGNFWLSAADFARGLSSLLWPNLAWVSTAMRMMTEPQATTDFPDLQQGLGWMLRTAGEKVYAFHNGASVGGYAEIWIGEGYGFGFCTNASIDLSDLSSRLLDLISGR
jgi:CubicO group peptidase (beta-lactamase class C family)